MTTIRRKRRPKAEPEQYRDGHGVAFHEARFLLGEDRTKWPRVVRVTDEMVCRVMHQRFMWCWNCDCRGTYHDGVYRVVQAHHMAAGSRGKSDEFCAIVMLCQECHASVNTPALPLGRLLWLKWQFDKANVSWERLTLLHGFFLPELEVG